MIEFMRDPSAVTDCLQGALDLRRSAIKYRCESVVWRAASMSRDRGSALTWLTQCPRSKAGVVSKGVPLKATSTSITTITTTATAASAVPKAITG